MSAHTARGTIATATPRARAGVALAVLTSVVVTLFVTAALLLGASTLGPAASAQDAPPPTAGTPYGGALDLPDPGDSASDDRALEVGMLVVGTVNGLLFVGAMVLSRLRGSSHAATRRALITRTGAGTVSEAGHRPRRERPRAGARVPVAERV